MSYILDALRRAEADRERERGQVPGLHTQAVPGADTVPAAGPKRWLPWAAGTALLLGGVGAGLWWASRPGDEAARPPLAMTPAMAPAMAPAAAPAMAPTPAPLAMPATPALPSTPPVATQQTAAPLAASAPSPYLPALVPPAPAVLPAPAPAPAVTPAAAARPAPAASAEARIPAVAELPEALRRELPRLVISGSVFSDDPAARFVMINGDAVREGARLGPDLVLEQIRPRELVLSFKGQRFRQPV